MSEYPVLSNTPISEALLDIQVTLPPDVGLPALAAMQEAIKDRFPNRREKKVFEFVMHVGESSFPETKEPASDPEGYMFDSPEGGKIVQARLTGYTFHKMKPYESWESFRDEARKLWELYRELVRPTAVKRLALRYIHRIELPLPVADLKEYILTVPDLAPGIPQGLGSFFMRLVMPTPDEKMTAIVTEVMEPVTKDQEKATILMDIDVFREQEYDPHSDTIWKIFEDLRDLKDTIFSNSLTDKTKGLFQ